MSDEDLRELERKWKESGNEEDAEAYLAARLRTGEPDTRRLLTELVAAQQDLAAIVNLIAQREEMEVGGAGIYKPAEVLAGMLLAWLDGEAPKAPPETESAPTNEPTPTSEPTPTMAADQCRRCGATTGTPLTDGICGPCWLGELDDEDILRCRMPDCARSTIRAEPRMGWTLLSDGTALCPSHRLGPGGNEEWARCRRQSCERITSRAEPEEGWLLMVGRAAVCPTHRQRGGQRRQYRQCTNPMCGESGLCGACRDLARRLTRDRHGL